MNKNWLIERLEVGMLMVNCYIVAWLPTSDAVIIDPGDEVERILGRVKQLGLHVNAIINTHGHGDHIGGNREIIAATGAPLWIGKLDAPMLPDAGVNMSAPFGMAVTSPTADMLLVEGDKITIGEGVLDVVEAPGHSPGSVMFVGDGFVICGDVLFAGSIGRTDFPGGSMNMLLRMIREKIFTLGDDYIVYPGHGPESTVEIEKRTNPFLQPGFNAGLWI